jgi:cyclopropane fatty-acyl-phospholipid synthase-like methyltransferase
VDKIRTTPWFKTWFNSPYYHVLYDNRNETEAQTFIDNLLNNLNPQPDAKMLDLACGKGRHSVYLATKGYDVVGLDLSERSIREANKFQHNKLHFYTHDMRQVYRINYFDYIFNFFTSFGYFENETENIKTLKAIYKGLNWNGIVAIDFLNVFKAIEDLPQANTVEKNGIKFEIKKQVKDGFIIKEITVTDNGTQHFFAEKVQALTLQHFRLYFEKAGLKIIDTFGSYNLTPFEQKQSERLIIIGNKAR